VVGPAGRLRSDRILDPFFRDGAGRQECESPVDGIAVSPQTVWQRRRAPPLIRPINQLSRGLTCAGQVSRWVSPSPVTREPRAVSGLGRCALLGPGLARRPW
jgi:hypothetical protein